MQETCARVLARPRLLRGQDELAYLMTVLRNTFLTQRRTAARRPRIGGVPIDESDPVDPGTGQRPEEALEAREVFGVIAALPERYRLALVAVDIAGLSYREAAAVLETKEATIATRVFRARQQVALRLTGESASELGSADLTSLGGVPDLSERPSSGGEPSPGGVPSPGVQPHLTGEPSPSREPNPSEQPSPTGEPSSGGESGPSGEPNPGEQSDSSAGPSPSREPSPADGVPEAPRVQREGRPPRRRLTQRGHE